MSTTYTALFAADEGWIVGWVRELPGAIVQEHTLEDARASLKEVIALILETRSAEGQAHNVIARELITVDV